MSEPRAKHHNERLAEALIARDNRIEELEARIASWSRPLADAEAQKLIDQLVEAQKWMQREECNGSIKPDPVYSTLYGHAAAEIAKLHKLGG